MQSSSPLVTLVILDGFGCAPPGPGNAVDLADTPVFDRLWRGFPHTTIEASGEAAGLPPGQMGNSEVGHLTIGAGRRLYQDLMRVNRAIADESLFTNPALVSAFERGNRDLFEKGMLKVIDEVHRVFDTNTQANEVLRQATFRTQSRVDRCMASCVDVRETMKVERCGTYDMTQGMLIRELTQPKETEIPQRRVAPTMRSESALSPVVKESTAPYPSALRS